MKGIINVIAIVIIVFCLSNAIAEEKVIKAIVLLLILVLNCYMTIKMLKSNKD